MSKEKQNIKIVPELRFPEFANSKEWEEKELNLIANRITQKNKDGKVDEVFTNSAVDGIVDQREYFDKDIADKNNLENYYIVERGNYVYNPRISKLAPVGPISKNRTGKTGVMSPLYTIFCFFHKNDDFYEYYFKSSHWYDSIRKVSNTGARHDRMSISSIDFMNISVLYPEPKEQQKIAECLSSLDDLIGAESEKLDFLKEHKKGLLQQLFPAEGETVPQLRFAKFVGDGDWEEKRLTDFNGLISGDGDWILSKDITLNGKHKLIQLSSIGFGIFNKKVLKTISNDTFLSLKGTSIFKGDLLINRMVDSKKINSCIFPLKGNYITSVDVCWIRENSFFNNYFFMNLLCTNNNQIKLLSLSSGAGRIRISKKNLFEKFIFLLPQNPKEQQKIADCLSSLDDLIEAEREKIDMLKEHKKGLMQGLFPRIDEMNV